MNNNGSKSNQKGNNGNYQKYVGAPYNFVSLPKSIVTRRNKESELPDHQKILEVSGEDKMYSGEIEYSIVPQTDIFVGGVSEKNKDGKEIQKFYQVADGTYAIPGSTVRGLLRTNTQILGLGSIDDDVEDNKMMYRKVAGAKENLLNTYKNTMNGKGKKGSQYDGVRAGYIECRNGQYYIYQPGRELDEELPKENYYTLNEKYIFAKEDEAHKERKPDPFALLKDYQEKHDYLLQYKRESINEMQENEEYVPFYIPISYNIERNEKKEPMVTAVGELGECERNGYLMGTGKMSGKKIWYVIPAVDKKRVFNLKSDEVNIFKTDYNAKENQLGTTAYGSIEDEEKRNECIETTKSFFKLPEEGKIRPVFYVRENGMVFFGYARNLRLLYHHAIKDGIPKEHKKESRIFDYAHSMYGYSIDSSGNEKKSYKGRIYVEDAKLQPFRQKDTIKKNMVTAVLGSPKPSSYLDYLCQGNVKGGISYNDDAFEIRGYKQYWLRKNANNVNQTENDNTVSNFCPLSKRCGKFTGKIRFKNLTKDELGLLLWTIRLEEGKQQNIGKAKAYGYGRIVMEVEKLQIYDYEKMYNLNQFCLNPFEDYSDQVEMLIKYYKKYQSISKDNSNHRSINEFFMMKDADQMPDTNKIENMKTEDYKSRKLRLQTVSEIHDNENPDLDISLKPFKNSKFDRKM